MERVLFFFGRLLYGSICHNVFLTAGSKTKHLFCVWICSLKTGIYIGRFLRGNQELTHVLVLAMLEEASALGNHKTCLIIRGWGTTNWLDAGCTTGRKKRACGGGGSHCFRSFWKEWIAVSKLLEIVTNLRTRGHGLQLWKRQACKGLGRHLFIQRSVGIWGKLIKLGGGGRNLVFLVEGSWAKLWERRQDIVFVVQIF